MKVTNDTSLKQENPSNFEEIVAEYPAATTQDVDTCIDSALKAKPTWESMPFEDRAAILLRASDLIAGKYRAQINAATMLGQGKNIFQAEIDAACETVDFIRYYIQQVWQLYGNQPQIHTPGTWNKLLYRPLEGFVYAIAPFNFTALAGTLVIPALLLGNVVVWKPSDSALHSSWVLHQILLEAGLPEDVLKFVPGRPVEVTDAVLRRSELSGVTYIGSTAVFKELLGKIGQKTAAGTYRSYPRVIGETGGKNFHLVHSSADVRSAAINTIKAAFEYQGQKCSACSRAYIAESVWPEFKKVLVEETEKLKVGDVEQFDNFINPVIHKRAFDRLDDAISRAKDDPELTLLTGGKSDGATGYYVYPTVYQTTNPRHEYMSKEYFGPMVTIYVYPDSQFAQTLKTIDTTSTYALTGSIFARDQIASRQAQDALRHACGMLYLNTKCTGSVVAQQPFGGSRDSGTNDKSGTAGLLSRFTSIQTIKEEFGTADQVLNPSNEV